MTSLLFRQAYCSITDVNFALIVKLLAFAAELSLGRFDFLGGARPALTLLAALFDVLADLLLDGSAS